MYTSPPPSMYAISKVLPALSVNESELSAEQCPPGGPPRSKARCALIHTKASSSKKRTAVPRIPAWSPTAVLTRLDPA